MLNTGTERLNDWSLVTQQVRVRARSTTPRMSLCWNTGKYVLQSYSS